MAEVGDDCGEQVGELDLELGVVALQELGDEVRARNDQVRLRVLQHVLQRREEALHVSDEQEAGVVAQGGLQGGDRLVLALRVLRLEACDDFVWIHGV